MSRSSAAAALRAPAFAYRGTALQRKLYCEKVSLQDLASRYGTPLYVYSAAMIRERMRSFARAFRSIPHTICYSVKANSTLGILRLVASEGAGFDVVSGGELERVLRISPKSASRVVFSGVGKTAAELELALRSGIMLFNIESARRNDRSIEEARADRDAGESRCFGENPSIHFNRAASAQIRRTDFGG